MTAIPSTLHPRFLHGSAGRIFTLYFEPHASNHGAVLCIPPFGEEMNRTRSLLAAQSREFAAMGYASLILDLYGTGDSEGDLPDATWDTWCGDIDLAANWLEDASGCKPVLWGTRVGSLLAAEVADRQPGRFERLLFWQPTPNGKSFVTQTLRQRVAALVDRGAPAETTAQMRETLNAGGNVEVSGYVLPGELSVEIDKRQLAAYENLSGKHIDWLECVVEEGKSVPGGSAKAIAALQSSGAEVKVRTVVAPQVWSLHKKADGSALVDATSTQFRT